jgi:hypothetical protein
MLESDMKSGLGVGGDEGVGQLPNSACHSFINYPRMSSVTERDNAVKGAVDADPNESDLMRGRSDTFQITQSGLLLQQSLQSLPRVNPSFLIDKFSNTVDVPNKLHIGLFNESIVSHF